MATEYDQEFNNEVEHACSILGLNAIKGPTWTSQYKLECGVTSILSSRGYTHVEMEDVLLKTGDETLLILRTLADRAEENQSDNNGQKNDRREAATTNLFKVLEVIYDV